MKKIVVIMLMLSCVGCNRTVTQLETDLNAFQAESDNLTAEIVLMQEKLSEVSEEMKAPELSSEVSQQLTEFYEQLSKDLDVALEYKQEFDVRFESWKEKVIKAIEDGDLDTAEQLILAGEGAKEIAPMLPPPFNTFAYAGGSLAVLLGGAWGRKKQLGEKKNKEALRDVVKSVSSLLDPHNGGPITSENDVKSAKKVLFADQDKSTVKIVKEILEA